jgi:hypothetical protein
MKKCTKCGIEQPLSEFYPRSANCKPCYRARVADRINLKKQDPEWVAKERARCRAKTAKARAEGRIKGPSPEVRKRWVDRNKAKRSAHLKAYSAIRRGTIKKPDACSACATASPRLEAHHTDYSQPLNVQWLCTKCHGKTRWKDGGVIHA